MSGVTMALGVVIVASTAAGVFAVRRSPAAVRASRSPWRHPGLWLLAVTVLIYVNQVLFTVYVLRVRHGDPTFIARYLPAGWFALAGHDPFIGRLAAWFPAPGLLSVTVLRVQAFLELPFVVSAYLLVCRWFGPYLFRRAVGLVRPAAVSYTAVFCLVEWDLRNPYTVADLVIRVVSAVVVAVCVPRLVAYGGRAVGSPVDLVIFGVSTAMLGYLVLAVYDTALLYNLGHVGAYLPRTVPAAVMLAAARAAAARTSGRRAGPHTDLFIRTVRWFFVVFWVPALPIRYGLGFGAAWLSAATGLVVAAVAVRGALGEVPDPRVRRAGAPIVAAAGTLGGATGLLVTGGYPEMRLLAGAAGFFLAALTACVVRDTRARSRDGDLEYGPRLG